MLTVLAITGPIYIVIALGFLAGRADMFSAADLRVLGRFVVKFALPALLFTALSQRPIADILNVRYLCAYAVGSLLVFFGALLFARMIRRKTMAQSTMIAMGMSFSNSGFVGYPIVLQILGTPAAIALAMCMIVENVFLFPLALTLADMGGDHEQKWQQTVLASFAALARNPMILAIFAGLAVSLLGIKLSEPLLRTVNMLAMASTALALFVIGGSLVGLKVRSVLGDAIGVALGKLLLHPLAVFALLWLLAPIDPPLRTAAVIYASVPMLSIYPVLGQKYHQEGFCAAALLMATLLSFMTVTGVLWLLTSLPGWTN